MDKLNRRKSSGFTLVELLIVIIIIGILAGSMMLVAGGGTDKANATKIVSDMRTMKTAALMYYADNDKWTGTITDLDSYMDRGTDSDKNITYSIDTTGSPDILFLKGALTGEYATDGVKDKLTKMATKDGLLGTADSTDIYDNDANVFVILK